MHGKNENGTYTLSYLYAAMNVTNLAPFPVVNSSSLTFPMHGAVLSPFSGGGWERHDERHLAQRPQRRHVRVVADTDHRPVDRRRTVLLLPLLAGCGVPGAARERGYQVVYRRLYSGHGTHRHGRHAGEQ